MITPSIKTMSTTTPTITTMYPNYQSGTSIIFAPSSPSIKNMTTLSTKIMLPHSFSFHVVRNSVSVAIFVRGAAIRIGVCRRPAWRTHQLTAALFPLLPMICVYITVYHLLGIRLSISPFRDLTPVILWGRGRRR